MENTVKAILRHIGEDPDREGLKDTPARVLRVWEEQFAGYKNPKPRVAVFKNGSDGLHYDQMIIDSGPFFSTCEHHILPFFGRYHFAYIPNPDGNILGLSKVARVVDYFAARLQIQERLGSDVVHYLWDAVNMEGAEPLGMAIVLKAEHLCKTMRGVKKQGTMTTAYLLGIFKTSAVSRSEFLTYAERDL